MYIPFGYYKESEEERYRRRVRVATLKAKHLSERMSHFMKGLTEEKLKKHDKETIIKQLLQFMEISELPFTNKTNP